MNEATRSFYPLIARALLETPHFERHYTPLVRRLCEALIDGRDLEPGRENTFLCAVHQVVCKSVLLARAYDALLEDPKLYRSLRARAAAQRESRCPNP